MAPVRTLVLLSTAALLLTACGGAPTPAVTVTEAAPAPAVTVSVTPTPSPPETASEGATEEPAEAATEAPVETFTMPTLVGQNLQLAQDILQDKGSFLMDQEDASGLDRVQVNDSNWQVCSQSPKAGKKTSVDTVVTLSAVKLDESCP